MADDKLIDVRLLFGSVEIQELPPRIVGTTIYPRYRTIERDGFGGVKVSEPKETGVSITNALEFRHLWAMVEPYTPTEMQKPHSQEP